jgi:AP-4 complex subunit epsilon-1
VFEYGSEFMDNDVLNNFFKLIIDNFNEIGFEFGEFIVDIYLEILNKPNQSDNMIKLIVWVLGEIGS